MPKVSSTLSMVSILVILISQTLAKDPVLTRQLSATDAFFAFVLMFCLTGILTSWLGRPIVQKQEDEPPTIRKKEEKKDQPN